MARKHQYLQSITHPRGEVYISDNDIFVSACSKDDDFSDILSCQWSNSLVNFLCRLFVAAEANYRELRFHLSRINVNHSNSRGDEFMPHCFCERLHRSLGSTVNRSSRVGHSSRN